jgi:hypothetical protein
MRVTLSRAGVAVGARATARAKGRRARGRAVGMTSRRAVCERQRAAARSTARRMAHPRARVARKSFGSW